MKPDRVTREVTGRIELDPYLTLEALVKYAGLSARWLRAAVKDPDPKRRLPHFRIAGKILVRRSEFDAWMEQYRAAANTIEETVQELLQKMP